MIQHAFIFAPGHGIFWMIGVLLVIVIYKWKKVQNVLFYVLVFPFVLPYTIIHDIVMTVKRKLRKRISEKDF